MGPPVLLILFGALLGLIPRFGGVRVDGEIVLLLFLPAILYWEGTVRLVSREGEVGQDRRS